MEPSLSDIACIYDTDKTESQDYIGNYEHHFGHLRSKPIKLLELGVHHGGSLRMWQEYFPAGLIVGLDLQPNPFTEMPERVRFYRGSQDDEACLDQIASECAPDGFDIVIDDASHIGKLTRASFRNLFGKHLKHGSVYVIEDWGTGYWNSWPDGMAYRMAREPREVRSSGEEFLSKRPIKQLEGRQVSAAHHETDDDFAMHNFGMVGFIKELVDEVAWPDITFPNRGNRDLPRRASMIREMTIYCGHAFIVKA